MRSRLFHAIVVSSASFAGGCTSEPLAPPASSDGGTADMNGPVGVAPIDDGFGPPRDMLQGVDAGLQCCDGNMTIYDMGLAIGVAPIDGFGPPPDLAKGFDGGVVPTDMGMTVIYDLAGQKDLP